MAVEQSASKLAVEALTTSGAGQGPLRSSSAVDWSLQEQLLQCSRDDLVDVLLSLAAQGDSLRSLVQAALDEIGETQALGGLVLDLIAVPGPLNASETHDYAQAARSVPAILRSLLERGRGAEVRRLAEHALSTLNNAISQLDDSSGDVTELAREIGALHLLALQALAPLPESFAQAYVKMRVLDEYDSVARLPAILPLLTEGGDRALRDAIALLWQDVPSLGPDDGFDIDMRGHAPVKMMKLELAQHDDDWRAEFEVAARDLRYPGIFAHLAMLCEEHGDSAQARLWLERGVLAHPHSPDLRMLLAEALLASGDRQRALELVWRVFEAAPENRRALRLLERCAGEDWPHWVPRVLALTRGVALNQGETPGNRR